MVRSTVCIKLRTSSRALSWRSELHLLQRMPMLSVAAGTAAARERVPGHLVEAPALAEVDERAARLWAVEDAPLALASGEVDVPTVPQCAAEVAMEAAWLAGAAGAMASPVAAAGATRIEAAAGITLTVTGEDVIGGQDLDGIRQLMAITTAGTKTATASNVVAVGGRYATISVIRRGGGDLHLAPVGVRVRMR